MYASWNICHPNSFKLSSIQWSVGYFFTSLRRRSGHIEKSTFCNHFCSFHLRKFYRSILWHGWTTYYLPLENIHRLTDWLAYWTECRFCWPQYSWDRWLKWTHLAVVTAPRKEVRPTSHWWGECWTNSNVLSLFLIKQTTGNKKPRFSPFRFSEWFFRNVHDLIVWPMVITSTYKHFVFIWSI